MNAFECNVSPLSKGCIILFKYITSKPNAVDSHTGVFSSSSAHVTFTSWSAAVAQAHIHFCHRVQIILDHQHHPSS